MAAAATAQRRADVPAFAVLGATSWGVTLAWLLSLNHERVFLIVRDQAEADRVAAARGLARLPEVNLPAHVAVVPDVPSASELSGVLIAVPAQSFAVAVARIGHLRGVPILSAAKGIELTSGRRMSEILAANRPESLVGVLSGPNLAHEVAQGLPAAAVIASSGDETALLWQAALASPFFRFYTSRDVVGVELAGSLKNVVAIAAGAANGLHLGANATAAMPSPSRWSDTPTQASRPCSTLWSKRAPTRLTSYLPP